MLIGCIAKSMRPNIAINSPVYKIARSHCRLHKATGINLREPADLINPFRSDTEQLKK